LQVYNKKIVDESQPLLLHKPKKREGGHKKLEAIVLIPELCYCTGLTDEIRSDFRVMKDLAYHTRVAPEQRRQSLRQFCETVAQNPEASAELAKWGLELDPDTIMTRGRVLPPETIVLGNREVSAGERADFGGVVCRNQVINAVNVENWLLVATARDQSKLSEFIQNYQQVSTQMGIQVHPPKICTLNNDRNDAYLKALRDNINSQTQIVVIVMPTSRDDRYNAVKKLCCTEIPVASQVINARTIRPGKSLRSVCQKIALQMNCKLGGELWAVKIPGKGLMTVGIDTYHDGKGSGAKSVGGFVASINNKMTQWYSRVCFQSAGQELIDGLKVCFTAALRKYHECNQELPSRIIVFRDGVGDGDLLNVSEYEVAQLATCFSQFGAAYQPNFAVIVVQKRINTKLFAAGRNGQLQNPSPGTVMDHTITRRNLYDFFLVSQHVNQGTVNPTHYVVVHDHSSWDADKLQRLTYKLTHVYYNWPGSVRVPAPCQYAHKLAYLVGQNIRKDPSLFLSDRLFFL